MRRAVAALAATAVLLAGCTSDADQPEDDPSPAPAASPTGDAADEGFSAPVEDSVYPDVGDPGVDALHYALTLTWDPKTQELDGLEKLTFRATDDADEFQLDLGRPLAVGAVTMDGKDTAFEHDGKDLVVDHPVTEDGEYTVFVHYSGTPEPVPAPVQRSDFSATGWTAVPGGGVWTMQEPYGAYSWYAVNDQPSDKALYDITLRVPPPMVGVANGTLRSHRVVDGLSVSRWHLDEPAASYLVTVALGDFQQVKDESPSGVPISYWVPRGRDDLVRRLRAAPAGMAWLEEKLGPFPFDSLGFLVVPSFSGMETQTMITLGDTKYATGPEVLVHEMAHHWYGDTVTPRDWRDVWMNEGMATFLQGVWMSEHGGPSLDALMAQWGAQDQEYRTQYGPPADYHHNAFASPNVYYIPAVMWNELRKKLGDDVFWPLVGKWPETHENSNADYDEITGWWSDQTGEDLSDFFDSWLLSEDTPDTTAAPAAATTRTTGQLDRAVSSTVEDRVYPDVGDPGVDALHYDLSLDWDPASETLDAVETLLLRATEDADRFQLDLAQPLDVASVTVQGDAADFEHPGKDLVVDRTVSADRRYTVVIRYSGEPEPVPAPVQRSDFEGMGWHTTADGGAWTLQEPFGAYSWFAVNDQPSDKAYYDITVRAPTPMVGISNGVLTSRRTDGDDTVTSWRLDDPASSYLVTVAIGDYEMTQDRSASGVPITYWTPRGEDDLVTRLRQAPAGLAWLEDKLGPYPFDSLGFLVVDADGGMETQSTITLGDTEFATAPGLLVHEMAHQWYGDTVTPRDWRDVWMNEGMATYLGMTWSAESEGRSLEKEMGSTARVDASLRRQYGPPGDYDPDSFTGPNVYNIPAVMWDQLRKRVGDHLFWRLVRKWPQTHANSNADYDEITQWWSDQTGQDLSGFFHDWLLSKTTPAAAES